MSSVVLIGDVYVRAAEFADLRRARDGPDWNLSLLCSIVLECPSSFINHREGISGLISNLAF